MTLRLFRPEPALHLAILRIVVPLVILVSPELWQAEHWAALPPPLRIAPELLGHATALLPTTTAGARIAMLVLIAACVACALGLLSRWSAGLVTLAGLYVFALSQLGGAVVHDMHLFWFSGLLAVSPCGDALSVDRMLRRARGTAAPDRAATSLAHGVPLQAVRLLLGVIYFFPGFWKLRASGPAWIFSDNLQNQMYSKWYQHDFLPPIRIDRWPLLLEAGALAVVGFELSFFALVLCPRLRWIALGWGLLFHGLAEVFLRIQFMSLWACYVVLIDWSSLLARGRNAPAPPNREPDRLPKPALLLAALLLAISVVQGARGAVQAWPFACYPTFQWIADDAIADLRIEAVRADGSRAVITDGPSTGGQRSQADWALAWTVAGFYGKPAAPDQLRAYYLRLCARGRACDAARGAVSLRFFAAHYSTVPERRGSAPLDQRPIGELALP
jgi:hypothetical protein